MAPALSKLFDSEPHPRRALTSVGNLSPMDDDMGLQSGGGLSKDTQDVEQMLVELGGTDIAQADLLQAIKTLEGGGDGLSAGDADAIFPLSGFDRDELLDTVDSEGDIAEDKIRSMQARLDRRTSFLLRRMRIFQARSIGKRVSEEAGQVVERVGRCMRREAGAGRPCALKSVVKRIESTAVLQASAHAKTRLGPSYFHIGRDSKVAVAGLGVPLGSLAGVADTASALRSHLRVVESQLDSDATASSSGAESNDDAVPYNNPHQEHLDISRRALWHWQRRRASIAARWAWLQAQVQDLEYKIRQHTELHRQVRASKGALQLVSVGGYSGPLPGASGDESCARARPLRRDAFRKRKLLQMHGVHAAAPKAAKPADIRCGCQYPVSGCAVCTGRAVSTQPSWPASTLPPAARLALLDPGYHPVLATPHDISPSIHLSAHASQAWWSTRAKNARGSRHLASGTSAASSTTTTHHPGTTKKKHSSGKHGKKGPGRPPNNRKKSEAEEVFVPHETRERVRPRLSTTSVPERRANSFDIDNIVIPPSVAATTRLEILHYKEIPTPKWRVTNSQPLNNGVSRHDDIESEDEDTSEANIAARHQRAELAERNKYARKQRVRRSNHQNSTESCESVAAETSHSVHGVQCSTTADHDSNHSAESAETVRPYSPRRFPLPETTYRDMLLDMPESPAPSPEPDTPEPEPEPEVPDEEPEVPDEEPEVQDEEPEMPNEELEMPDEEPASPMSPLFGDEEDSDDPEWKEPDDDKR